LWLLYCVPADQRPRKIGELFGLVKKEYEEKYEEPVPTWLDLTDVYNGLGNDMKKRLADCFGVHPDDHTFEIGKNNFSSYYPNRIHCRQ
jgi:hypothetical protein